MDPRYASHHAFESAFSGKAAKKRNSSEWQTVKEMKLSWRLLKRELFQCAGRHLDAGGHRGLCCLDHNSTS
jgi:hypothetical protein